MAGRPLRGLIVEDEGIIVILIRRALVAAGYEIAGAASDGELAITVARKTQPDFILMDVNMPIMGGIEATRKIIAERQVPIIMLTAYSNKEYIEAAKNAGACGYISKPVFGTLLIAKVQECLAAYGEGKTVFPQWDPILDQTIG